MQKIFKKLYEKGDIYKGKYEGKYCTPCESFWTETPAGGRQVPGLRPSGRRCRRRRPISSAFPNTPTGIQDLYGKHRLSAAAQPRAMRWSTTSSNPAWRTCASPAPRFTWGVPVDFDPKHVVYVWIDALSNYITALGYEQWQVSRLRQVLAGRRPLCRQGDRPLPLDHLACHADGAGSAAAQSRSTATAGCCWTAAR